VNRQLKIQAFTNKIIKDYCGKIINFIQLSDFTFGKEMQLHVMEVKANKPFKSPVLFEETMQTAITTVNDILDKKYGYTLLGTGMHPLMKLEQTAIWPHYHQKIYREYGKIFNLQQHGWLNIQSFHLNIPYHKESDAIQIHNYLANLCAYLPAITASSPIFEGKNGLYIDNRLHFYQASQKEVPSLTGKVIPEYVSSFSQYKTDVIERYSQDLARVGANRTLLFKEWVNSRGVIFKFDRSALEIRVMDEQECIKSDVALSCFVRAAIRGLLTIKAEFLPHDVLVEDFNATIKNGLNAKVAHSSKSTARQVCQYYLKLANEYADHEEKKYLWLVKRRLEEGNLSELIRDRVMRRTQKTDLNEAIIDVYSTLIDCLQNNQPYF
jgi:gamma-glutamyl:cysteine ligase YbdK (ATP-grasp superfamily)